MAVPIRSYKERGRGTVRNIPKQKKKNKKIKSQLIIPKKTK
jgi:hypothetical protein